VSDLPIPSEELIRTHAPLMPVWGCPEILIHQASDFFAVWQAWEAESGREREIPYWAVVWPAAAVLARYLLDHAEIVAGKRVLDLGCGGGAGGIAARKAGAACVCANDIDPVALHIMQRNAAANGIEMHPDNHDYTNSPQACSADVVLVADLFYQKTEAAALHAALRRIARGATRIYIADAGRSYAPHDGILLSESLQVPVNKELEGVCHRDVRLYLFKA
jgi:predicted nicotinamide N-methyase